MIKILWDAPNCNQVFDSGYEVRLHKQEFHQHDNHIKTFEKRNDV